MKHIKLFEQYNTKDEAINEDLVSFLKKIPGIDKYYQQAKEIYNQIKDDVQDLLQDLSEEDAQKIKDFKLSKLDSLPITESEENKDEKSFKDRILNIIGLSAGATGFISGIYSMIIAAIEQSGASATPWFLTFVVLLVVSGVTHVAKDDEEDKK